MQSTESFGFRGSFCTSEQDFAGFMSSLGMYVCACDVREAQTTPQFSPRDALMNAATSGRGC